MTKHTILNFLSFLMVIGITFQANAQIALPFTEGFNSDSPTQANWTIIDVTSDGNQWSTDNTVNVHEGDECAIIQSWGTGTEDDYLISPQITLTGNDRLIFHHRVGSSGYPSSLEIVLSTTTNDVGSFTETVLTNTEFTNYGWEEFTVDLSAYSGDVYIAFHLDGPSGFSFSIDNVIFETIASCEVPSGLNAADISNNSADLLWTSTASEFNIEWGVQGFTQGEGTIITAASNPYILTGLTSATSYDYWVKAICAVGDESTWAGPYTFTTLCETLTPDYLENFNLDVNIPACWNHNQGPLSGPNGVDGESDWIFEYDDATVNINNLNGNNEWLLSPVFDLSLGYELNFDVTIDAYVDYAMGADDQVQLLYSTNNGTSWSNLKTWTEADVLLVENYTIDLSAITGMDVRFAFWVSNGADMDGNDVLFSIDNFTVRTPADCDAPIDLFVTDITISSSSFAWTEVGAASTWDIEVVTAGTTPTGTPTYSNVSANPFLINGLTAVTAYDIYVRSDCDGGGNSDWSTITFTTECDVVSSYPFVEDFEAEFLPICWTKELPDTDEANDITQSEEGNHTEDGAYSVQFTSFNESISDPAEYNQYLITPTFNINESNLEFSFWHSKGEYYDEAEELSIGIATSTDTVWSDVNLGAEEWLIETIDLSSYENENIFFIFHYYGDYLYYVYIDDVRIGVPVIENTEAEILTYSIDGQVNSYVSSVNDSIHVTIPIGSSISNLIADFTLSVEAEATIYTVEQISGITPNNWESMNPIPYTVTSEDGEIVRIWSVYVDVLTGINTLVNAKDITVYPNPSKGQFNIAINLKTTENVNIDIINMQGQVVSQYTNIESSQTQSFDLTQQAAGLYYIRISTKTENIIKKINITK